MKPIDSMLNVINALSHSESVKVLKNNGIYSFKQNEEPFIFMLHSGKAGLYRTSDGLLLSTVSSPMIVGSNLLAGDSIELYIQADNNLQYEILHRKNIEKIFDEKGLWKDIAYINMYVTVKLTEKIFNISRVSAYEMIKGSLTELMQRNDRGSVNACDFIMERTLLSRSTVMKVLKELRVGEYIKINRGVLIETNKLPDNF